MQYPLPTPIPAGFSYDALLINNVRYDAEARTYTADVFGITGGNAVPFIFMTRSGLQRVPICTITDTEIDEVMAADPAITVRLDAGLRRAMERLYALVNS
jgi:hypothetical protein